MTLGSRLRAAFSLRRNWRQLVTPPPGSLQPLDGIRALSILWVILFHVGWFVWLFIPPDAVGRMASDPALRLVWCGDLGVDCFFTISGFLIADLLMAEHDATRTIAVRRFYLRRAMRLLPVYFLVLWIYCRLDLPDCDWAWANLLHINNFIQVEDQCMPWAWSLAVEEQFYVLIPLLVYVLHALRPRHRLWLLAGLVAAALAISAWLVIRHGFTLPLAMFPSLDRVGVTRFFDAIYDKPYARFGPLAVGVLVAFLRRHTRLIRGLERHTRLVSVGVALAFVALALIVAYPTRDPGLAGVPRSFGAFYLATFRIGVSVAVAYLFLVSLSNHRVGLVLARFLSHRGWYPIAQLSYSVYLLHPICILVVYGLARPTGVLSPAALLGYGLVDLSLSLAAGAVIYLLLERPLMNLRPSRGLLSSAPPRTTA